MGEGSVGEEIEPAQALLNSRVESRRRGGGSDDVAGREGVEETRASNEEGRIKSSLGGSGRFEELFGENFELDIFFEFGD